MSLPVDRDRSNEQSRLRVIIVGGGIAGLTLAHCLSHSNIDYVVLEKRSDIAPQVGASIVVLPNGARILDQLGIIDHLLDAIEPLDYGSLWTANGKSFLSTDVPLLIKKRTGYPVAFMQRYKLLRVLSEDLPDKLKLHTSKRVTNINEGDGDVTVQCADGSTYSGDIVVGTDGVHSIVKNSMLQHIENLSPGASQKDQNSVSAEYNCVYGMGTQVKGNLAVGWYYRTYAKDLSTMIFVGDGGILYWFLFTKLEKRYYGNDIPKYTASDAEVAAQAFFDMKLPHSTTYRDLWKTRTIVNMTSIEEAQNQHWTFGRLVCIGDSIHKQTINFGAGANSAIESAASLTNSISTFKSKPSFKEVTKALYSFYEKRHMRANLICDVSNELTRLEAFATPLHKFAAIHVIPFSGDYFTDLTCDAMVGAEMINTLPAPSRSLKATMPWDTEVGVGKHEKIWIRMLRAMPLLFLILVAQSTMGPVVVQLKPTLAAAVTSGQLKLADGLILPLWRSFYKVRLVDNFLSTLVALFTATLLPIDEVSRLQVIAFGADLIPLQIIWLVESVRRGNFLSAVFFLPTVFGLAYQGIGLGFVAPVYFFLHYIHCPIDTYHAMDNRLTQIGRVKSIVPSVTLAYILPTITMLIMPGLDNRQWINGFFWQLFPLYTALLQRIFDIFVKDTTKESRLSNPLADLIYLRGTYSFSFAVASGANLYARLASPVSIIQLFFGGLRNPSAPVTLIEGAAKFLRYDQIVAFSAVSLWLLLSFWDLKRARKLRTNWLALVSTFVTLVVIVGPGAAVVAMWAWREEALAHGGVQLKWFTTSA